MTESKLLFEPAQPNAQSRLEVGFTANSDILPGTSIYFKFGGIQRVDAWASVGLS